MVGLGGGEGLVAVKVWMVVAVASGAVMRWGGCMDVGREVAVC